MNGAWMRSAVGVTGLVAAATWTGCAPTRAAGQAGFGQLVTLSEFHVGYELTPGCNLQRADDKKNAPTEAAAWTNIVPNSLADKRFAVMTREPVISTGADPKVYMQMKVQEVKKDERVGAPFWLRNPGAASAEASALAWRCVVDREVLRTLVPKQRHKVVQLTTSSSECLTITPIIGGREDVVFAPYTVTRTGLFVGGAPNAAAIPVVGLTLEAEGGERSLTVPAQVADRCFVPASKPPPLPGEARALMDWLTSDAPETQAPPVVTIETVEAVTGINSDDCMHEGSGATTHFECRMPVLRITTLPGAGPFGPSVLQLTRERLIDSFHAYGGRLVAPSDVVGINAVVRTPKLGAESAFARVFQKTLGESMGDEALKLKRASSGFRLMRPSDLGNGVRATHNVDLDLKFNVPEIETSTETRTHKYIAGKKKIPNPEWDKAQQELEEARANVEDAKQKVELAKTTAETAKHACDGFSGLSALACKSSMGLAGSAISTAIVVTAQERFGAAQGKATTTPKELTVDDDREWPYQARILRRRGAAEAKVTIGPAMENVPTQFSTSVTVPFDASDEEVTADPEHKLPGKVAHPPSADDVQQALAQALIPKVDEAVIKWGAQRQVGGDLGDMQPGTRSWMVSVARHASSDRAIKLLSDIQETRSDILSQPLITYPVTMPEDSAKRCFTFAAISLDGKTDVNLKFGTPPPAGSKRMLTFGRDARSDPDAAFELCHIPKGQYVVAVSWGKEKSPKGVLVSMFDSTTGSATNDDTRAASHGLPTVPRKGEVLALNGSGLVQFKGTNNEVVSGKRGDRDGDGIEDERDRCPYDPETKNGYLDQDGCPDEVPEGFVATPEPMPASVAPVAQPAAAPVTPPPAPVSPAHRSSKKP